MGAALSDLRGRFKHYKGHLYEVLGIAKHSETLEELGTAYLRLDEEEPVVWVRPTAMFGENVEVGGKTVARFLKTDDKTLRSEVSTLRTALHQSENHAKTLQEQKAFLQKRVAVLEEQLHEPGYVDELRQICEDCHKLVPAAFLKDLHEAGEEYDIFGALPDLLKLYIESIEKREAQAMLSAAANWELASRAYERRDKAEAVQIRVESEMKLRDNLNSTEDRPLPEDAQIDSMHPARCPENNDTFKEAARLVGAKYSKYALVGLVNWLLVRIRNREKQMEFLKK